jgi:hypothetical protein
MYVLHGRSTLLLCRMLVDVLDFQHMPLCTLLSCCQPLRKASSNNAGVWFPISQRWYHSGVL